MPSVASLSKSMVKLPEPWCRWPPGVATPLANCTKAEAGCALGWAERVQSKLVPSASRETTSLKVLASSAAEPCQVQLSASQVVGSKSSVTCWSRSRKAATGTLQVAAAVTVTPKNGDDCPADESWATASVPGDDETACDRCGEPIDIASLLGIA